MPNSKYFKTIYSILGAIVFSFSTQAQTTSPAATSLPFTLKPLGHGVYAAIDDAKGDAGANAGFVVGDDGVLVIDTFENEAAAKLLLAEIRKLTKLPVKFVVNTHYHLDHVAGNSVFEQAGAVVMAQRNVLNWIHTENLKFFGKNIKPEEKTMVEDLGAPSVLYENGLEIFLGSRDIQINVFPGHTGGDSVVTISDAKIVFCGDIFWHNTLPNLIDASTEKWVDTLNLFSETSSGPTFVPGHGDIGNSADVKAFRDYLQDLRSMVTVPLREGKSGDELVNAVMPGLKAKYGSWNFFEYFAKPNILDMAAELNHKKRTPPTPQIM